MSDKYDLATMLQEIKEDERLAPGAQQSEMSQDDIRKLMQLKNPAKAGDHDKSE